MKLFSVIKKFFYDSFTKRDVNDRLRSIMQKYDEVVLPLIPKIRQVFGNGSAPASKYVQKFLVEYMKTLPSNLRRNGSLEVYLNVMERSLTNARNY